MHVCIDAVPICILSGHCHLYVVLANAIVLAELRVMRFVFY